MKIVGKRKWEKENKIGKLELSCGYQLLVVVKINISLYLVHLLQIKVYHENCYKYIDVEMPITRKYNN